MRSHNLTRELILHIRNELEEGSLPADDASSLEELYYNYKNAVKTGFDLCSIFNVLLSDCCSSCLAIFCYQVAQTGDANAYEIMLSNMMYRNSYICNISLFHDMEEKLRQQDHNVVLMSNHQTEADPAIIALLLEKSNPWISENIGCC
ncbi:glycerol-3-phosphate acyltransferase, chloroplastic-like isoform X2 [Panicum virgatum]|uniref:glycerol-3-phosphate acyltransferase, chloroplastic-like isoform X2 n=1 Tax=Panicum virgatum TaxID=38727 RepID=UPI0019D5B023|nr:glycerol-3-phosphate acyltransferase, chloroplastic-like isoform X2 [Panicum virgatum]